MLRRLSSLIQKEFIQLTRNRRVLISLLPFPLVTLILFAAAIHTDVKHIPMVVTDQSQSAASRSYLNAFVDSESFDIVSMVSSQREVIETIDQGQADLGMVIPPDFDDRVAHGDANVLILVDGSSSFTSQSANNAANAISEQYAVSLIRQQGNSLTAHLQILYNPDLKDIWFIAPAFIALLLQVVAQSLTAMSIVREREMGTIEALLVTPIRPVELMVAKMIPNLLVASVSAFSLLIIGILILGVPFRGNLLLFFGLSLIDIGCGLGLGLMISSAVQTQNQSQQLNMIFTVSGMFLGGLLFPVYTLPFVLRVLSYIFPMTYFIPIVRGLALKGIGFEDLWLQTLALVILLGTTLFIATRLFRERLD